jgi:hypothetical protein
MSQLRHENDHDHSFTTQSPAWERSLSRYTCNIHGNGPDPATERPPDHPVTAVHRVSSPALDCSIGPVPTGRGGAEGLCWVFSASRRGCPPVFSPAKYLRTCVTILAGLRGVSSRVARDGMDRSAGGDGGLPDLAVTAEIESKSKARFVKPCESGGESPPNLGGRSAQNSKTASHGRCDEWSAYSRAVASEPFVEPADNRSIRGCHPSSTVPPPTMPYFRRTCCALIPWVSISRTTSILNDSL